MRTRIALLAGAVLMGAGLAAAPATAAGADAPVAQAKPLCPVGVFCAYQKPDYTGPVWNVTGCGAREVPFHGVGAYDNNTQYWVRMFDRNYNVVFTAPPRSSDRSFDWSHVWYIRLC
ncbi:peptidase inhibitor family I36 protein [Streptomyces melanogenes]|uniref:Peptidase inhibitor family I36 protein n=1 Tax=Streptomyces melanogenes TaxID=67326 RepID=A0ABZ1XDG4_9ACTN|nr:peptidase inhibitor family I36 protein [Streptomyces melanogenes]